MRVGYILMAILFILIYFGAHYYLGIMAYKAFGGFIPYKPVYWIVLLFLAVSLIAGRAAKKYMPQYLSKSLDLIGSYWLAASIYLLMISVLISVILLINRWLGFIPKNVLANPNSAPLIGSLVIVFVIGLIGFGAFNAKKIHIANYNVEIKKSAGDLKNLNIVMISDIHLGEIIKKPRLNQIVNSINSLKPDIVLIGGDIIDNELDPVVEQNMGEAFKNIKSRFGTYACLGNHDYFSGNLEDKIKYFKASGITVLRDSYLKMNNDFYVIGREDASGAKTLGIKRKELDDLTKGIDKSLPMILLDHQPLKLEETEKAAIDLQLSGHTHYGQFFPVQYANKFVFEDQYGYLKKGNSNIIVSSGVGTWGPPIRLGSLCEIVNVKVKFTK